MSAPALKMRALLLAALCACLCAFARPVCLEGICYPSEAAARAAGVSSEMIARALQEEHGDDASAPRVAMGYMKPDAFLAFLRGGPADDADAPLARHSLAVVLLLVLLGGLAANLTPCVLPLVPVNLVLVGRGWRRGAAYGLGIALAYGSLGLAAAFGGLAFGAIQSNPWFNAFVAVVFTVLGLAMGEVFFIDFTKYRLRVTGTGGRVRGLGGVFLLGVGAAVLAGACVEPILLATLVLTAKWCAAGKTWAVVLPFILGVGMGLPWPFAAAGLSVLPKPGAWMRWVNRIFALVLFGMAVWYGRLAWTGFADRSRSDRSPYSEASTPPTPPTSGAGHSVTDRGKTFTATPETWEKVFAEAKASDRPVFVDVWASWCKNCLAMERTTFRAPEVVRALAPFTVVRLQAEDPVAFQKLKDFANLGIKGFPAFVIFPHEP